MALASVVVMWFIAAPKASPPPAPADLAHWMPEGATRDESFPAGDLSITRYSTRASLDNTLAHFRERLHLRGGGDPVLMSMGSPRIKWLGPKDFSVGAISSSAPGFQSQSFLRWSDEEIAFFQITRDNADRDTHILAVGQKFPRAAEAKSTAPRAGFIYPNSTRGSSGNARTVSVARLTTTDSLDAVWNYYLKLIAGTTNVPPIFEIPGGIGPNTLVILPIKRPDTIERALLFADDAAITWLHLSRPPSATNTLILLNAIHR
ncbi:MAG: hypothetical protein AB1705_15175 [Verrucomicrobiota bacterium]